VIRLEFRLDPDGTAVAVVESEDWHPDAAVDPWLAAWRSGLEHITDTDGATTEATS
jgi:hypothetical protein